MKGMTGKRTVKNARFVHMTTTKDVHPRIRVVKAPNHIKQHEHASYIALKCSVYLDHVHQNMLFMTLYIFVCVSLSPSLSLVISLFHSFIDIVYYIFQIVSMYILKSLATPSPLTKVNTKLYPR